MLAKIREKLKASLFSSETGGVLNYLTLSVSDPSVRKEVKTYRAAEFNRLFFVFNIFNVYNFVQQLFTYSTSSETNTELFYLINSIF